MRFLVGTLLPLCAVMAVITTGCSSAPKAVTFTTPYQAVLLSNNSVYYGKLEGFGTANPVLTSVFYIVSKSLRRSRCKMCWSNVERSCTVPIGCT